LDRINGIDGMGNLHPHSYGGVRPQKQAISQKTSDCCSVGLVLCQSHHRSESTISWRVVFLCAETALLLPTRTPPHHHSPGSHDAANRPLLLHSKEDSSPDDPKRRECRQQDRP
jgi:hypothetical protein